MPRDAYGYVLSTAGDAAAAYEQGTTLLLRLQAGATAAIAQSVVLDPTFALGHAALALLGHEMCAPVDVAARLADAERHAPRCTERERSHVQAVAAHVRGSSRPLVQHLVAYPRDALLLSTAVPTIAFAGVTEMPEEAWDLVERAAPSYGDDWWFAGLLAFIRQEQQRYDDAMDLACSALAQEPAAGHAAHARAHAHYETGDHEAGVDWMDDWIRHDGAGTESLSHFSWHAALHELSLGDLAAVRRRYESQLRPEGVTGCRSLVDSGSLLFRWALTPDSGTVPDIGNVATATGRDGLVRPATPFLAMHAAAVLLATGDGDGLRSLATWAATHDQATQREVVAPMTAALLDLHEGRWSQGADRLAELGRATVRIGGSDAQRELLEEARISALLRAGRWDEARAVLDARIDRRRSPRDEAWRRQAQAAS